MLDFWLASWYNGDVTVVRSNSTGDLVCASDTSFLGEALVWLTSLPGPFSCEVPIWL